jgi:LPXTG-site transpeptidase (sortase) family protein
MPLEKVLPKKFPFLFLIFVGLIVVAVGCYLFLKSQKPVVVKEEPKKEVSLHSKPDAVRLIISGVKIDLPVTEGKIVNGEWEATQEGVSHLDISANPGENGNIVIYGHNKRVLFGSLPYVAMGAKIKVIAEDGTEYGYKVYEKKDVAATDVGIAYATPGEVLTLYTCDGPLDGKRFVLLAKPVVE